MKFRKIDRKTYILYIVLSLEILLLTYFVYRYGMNHIDSDDSAEMILAKLLSQEGNLLSREWYYSTELRVLNTQLIMAPLFYFFTSWNTVRTVGTFILLIIYIVSFLVLCSQISVGTILKWLSPVLLWPFSLVYYDFVLFGLYYIPHLSIVFFSLALYFRLLKCSGMRYRISLLALLLLSCLSGMGGLRMLIVLYVPWVGTLLFCSLPVRGMKEITQEKVKSFTIAMLMLFAAGIGYLVNAKLLSKVFTFASWSNTTFTSIDFNRLGEVINDMLSMAGYRDGRSIISISGIVNVMVLFMAAAVVYFYIIVFRRYKKLTEEERILALFSLLALLATVCVGIFTNQNWSDRYMILPLINFVFIWAIYIKISGISYFKEKFLCLFIAGTLCISGLIEYRGWSVDSKTSSHNNVLEFLQANDYHFGYADWWGADVLTELSDGEVNMCKVNNWKEFSVWYWLMDKNYEKNAGNDKIFILIENNKLDFTGNIGYLSGEWKREELTYLDAGTKVYDDSIYSVFSYEDIHALKTVLP